MTTKDAGSSKGDGDVDVLTDIMGSVDGDEFAEEVNPPNNSLSPPASGKKTRKAAQQRQAKAKAAKTAKVTADPKEKKNGEGTTGVSVAAEAAPKNGPADTPVTKQTPVKAATKGKRATKQNPAASTGPKKGAAKNSKKKAAAAGKKAAEQTSDKDTAKPEEEKEKKPSEVAKAETAKETGTKAKVKEETKAKTSEPLVGTHPTTNAVSEDSDEDLPENFEGYDTRSEASSSSFDSQSSISSNDEKAGKSGVQSEEKPKKTDSKKTDHQGDQSTESPDGDAADSDGNRKRNHSPIVFDKDEEKEEPPPLPGPGEPAPETSEKMKEQKSKMKYLFRDARYFLIKSNNFENISLAKVKGVWSTLPYNEQRLNQAYRECRHVLLVFSVRESGKFQGFARLRSESRRDGPQVNWVLPTGMNRSMLGSVFKVDWITRHELSFLNCAHLYNAWNDNKPVKIGRDGQEVDPNTGEALCRLFPQDEHINVIEILRDARRRRREEAFRRREPLSNQQRQRRPPAPPPQRGPPLFLDRGKRRMDPRSGGLRGGDRPSKRMRPPPPLMHGQDNPRDVLVSGPLSGWRPWPAEYLQKRLAQFPTPPIQPGFSYDPNMPGGLPPGYPPPSRGMPPPHGGYSTHRRDYHLMSRSGRERERERDRGRERDRERVRDHDRRDKDRDRDRGKDRDRRSGGGSWNENNRRSSGGSRGRVSPRQAMHYYRR
ncbi:uncharacterized protein [Apostichopus japonicus]|uniref:uncharacterized protein isoform X2 n=1 Tax=Stichopus japonicus TaxID=307972 RepID=UPI003AB77237